MLNGTQYRSGVNITGANTESLVDIIHYNYGGYKSIQVLQFRIKWVFKKERQIDRERRRKKEGERERQIDRERGGEIDR